MTIYTQVSQKVISFVSLIPPAYIPPVLIYPALFGSFRFIPSSRVAVYAGVFEFNSKSNVGENESKLKCSFVPP